MTKRPTASIRLMGIQTGPSPVQLTVTSAAHRQREGPFTHQIQTTDFTLSILTVNCCGPSQPRNRYGANLFWLRKRWSSAPWITTFMELIQHQARKSGLWIQAER